MIFRTTLATLLLAFCLANGASAQTNYWTAIPASSVPDVVYQKNYKPAIFTAYQLNETALRNAVADAPLEGTIAIEQSPVSIVVPNESGVWETYKVVESPILEAGLAAQFSSIKTYLGVETGRSGSIIRFDLSPLGFHAAIFSPERKTVYINSLNNNQHYLVFNRDGMSTVTAFECKTGENFTSTAQRSAVGADDGKRRTFRLAITTTGEYSQSCLDGTETTDLQRRAKVLAVLTTNLNRANGVFDRDFGIRMNFVTGMESLFYLNATTDPFSTSPFFPWTWNDETQSVMDGFGAGNYDIGHMITKVSVGDEHGSAGCIACVCKPEKGGGFTAHSAKQGDPFVIDIWSHEMGHQFGANHTHQTNGDEGTGMQVEPGSGSTIMGYAGISGMLDIQAHADDYFHARSIDQVTSYLKSPAGATCAVVTNTGNSVPTANAGNDYVIPKMTPFLLTGQASDANAGDVLSYTWEQNDHFTSGSNEFPGATSTSGPVFRSLKYGTAIQRSFPAMPTVLLGNTSTTWEALSSVARTLNFRFTVRDNAASGGANNADDMAVTVDASKGPFKITSQNSAVTWKVGEYQVITWDVAGTTASPVSCANVTIELSTNGGDAFPVTLVASTPNDGHHEFIVPANFTNQARVRVKAVGNIFFDVNNASFSIQNPPAPEFSFSNPAAMIVCSGAPVSTTLSTVGLSGFSGAINLSASGNPAGTTVMFSNATINTGNSVTVSLQGTIPAGTHNITVSGTSGSITKTRVITVTVIDPAAPVALVSPANGVTNHTVQPSFSWSPVTGAGTYTVDIATNASFSPVSVSASGLTGTSHTLGSSLAGSTTYYWRVKAVTICGTLVSAARSFTTANCGAIQSTDVPKLIDASNPNTIFSNLVVGGSGIISDVDVVGVQGTHTYVGDLTFTLISPTGTQVTLVDGVCDSDQDFHFTVDDAAPISMIPCPPTGNAVVQPESPLSVLNGQNANGTWKLQVEDYYGMDGGSLNAWALRLCLSSGSLPVSWLDFSARRNGDRSVLIQWSTASEVNNNYYEIQRSRDGSSFETIGTMAAGTAAGIQQYLFNDMKPFAGVNYYRLKQVDNDGKFSFSSVTRVTMPGDRAKYTMAPNPATNLTTITAYTEMMRTNVKIVDVSGRTVFAIYRPLLKAGDKIEVPLAGIAKGYYLVVIESDNQRFTEKLVVQ